LEDLGSDTFAVRKKDFSDSTTWAKKIAQRVTGDFAVTSTGSYVYARFYHTTENTPYIVELDGSTGAVSSAIKG
jgi:hypothetical protein